MLILELRNTKFETSCYRFSSNKGQILKFKREKGGDRDKSQGIQIPFTQLTTRDSVTKGDGLDRLTTKEMTDGIMY